MDARIIQYYKLAAVIDPRAHTAANSADAKTLVGVQDLKNKFTTSNGFLIPNETVIGGTEMRTDDPNFRRLPIIVI